MNESIYTVFTTFDRPLSAMDTDASPIIKALRFGITAPNAHNTQPWTIDIRSDTEASLYFDPARSLPFTDPLFGRILHRRTSRRNHEGPRVTEAERRKIIEQSKREGVDAGMIGGDRFAEALEIIKQAIAIEVNDRSLYEDSLVWFCFSKREIAEKADGISC